MVEKAAERTQPAPRDTTAAVSRVAFALGGLAGANAHGSGFVKRFGVTALWLSPVFKQRGYLDTYHGYGVQDFLEMNPGCGTRQDSAEFCTAAHDQGIRVVLDIIFNHPGCNWAYAPTASGGPRHGPSTQVDAQAATGRVSGRMRPSGTTSPARDRAG